MNPGVILGGAVTGLVLLLGFNLAAAEPSGMAETPMRATNIAFLSTVAREVLRSAQVGPGSSIPSGPTNTTPWAVHLPGGTQNYYPAFWIRDAAMMLGGSFITADEVEGWIRLTAATQPGPDGLRFGRLIVPGYSIPDHITLSGGACWYPGAYTEQGNGAFGILPPADDAFYFVQMVYEHWRLSGSLTSFQSEVQTGWGKQQVSDVCLKAFGSVAADPETGLVRCERMDDQPRVDWGFCDTVRKAGLCLMPSLLRWQAALRLATLLEACDKSVEARLLRQEAAKIQRAIAERFPRRVESGHREETLLISATELGVKDDVWASAFAVWLGVLPRDLEAKVAQHLLALYRAGGTVVEGQVRHVPPTGPFGGYWEQAAEKDRYQNGGYWATPTGWLINALRKVDVAASDQLLAEYTDHLRRHRKDGAPWEWIYPPANMRVNPRYGSSAGCVYLAIIHESPDLSRQSR